MELSRRWYGSPTPPSKGNEWERGHLMYLNIDHAIYSCFYLCKPSCWTQGNASLASIVYPPSSRTFGKTTSCPSSVITVISIPSDHSGKGTHIRLPRTPTLLAPFLFQPFPQVPVLGEPLQCNLEQITVRVLGFGSGFGRGCNRPSDQRARGSTELEVADVCGERLEAVKDVCCVYGR